MEFIVQGMEDWQDFTRSFLSQRKHSLLLLKGNLGAGKTTFTQHLVRELGSADQVSSPTYALVNEYSAPEGTIFHFDLYRLKNAAEAYDIGIEEYLDTAFFSIIEWPEVYEEQLADYPHHTMQIETRDGMRHIFLTEHS